MIPIRDINPRRGSAQLTYAIIALNVAVFVMQLSMAPAELEAFIFKHGLVPQLIVQGNLGSWSTPFSSMFLHGGLLHIIGNMWFLHIFSDNVEDRLGKTKFLILYFGSGLGAALAQVLSDPTSSVPMIGASGAVSGVLGAYMVLFPRARILTVIPIVFFFQFVEFRAAVFSFVWFGYQLLMGALSTQTMDSGAGGIAFFAHIGGFIVGLGLAPVLRPKYR